MITINTYIINKTLEKSSLSGHLENNTPGQSRIYFKNECNYGPILGNL